MKIYEVTYEEYYDDFSDGGIRILKEWLYHNRDNALKKIQEIKPKIYEKYKDKLCYPAYKETDKKEHYAIANHMYCDGASVFITEVSTEDDLLSKEVVYSREYATTPDMQCPTCGKYLDTTYPRYCSDCGTKLRYRHEREV